MENQQIQNTDEVSVSLNEQTLLSTKYGSGQQPITFTTTYPMNVTVWWAPRSNNPTIDLILKKNDGEVVFSEEGSANTKNISTYVIQAGTYNIVSEESKEIWFYYLKLEPYIPSN